MSHFPDTGPPRVRRGAHRTRRSLVAALMPSVLAVAAVTALVTSLAVWQGEQPDQPRADAAAAATGRASASPASAAPSTTDATPSPAPATTSPGAGTTQTPAASASTQSAVEGTKAERTPTAEKTPAVDRSAVQVVVLNQTPRPGLAASVAAHLRAADWDVPAVGNFRGTVPSTTVYYPPGGEAVALAVARDLRSTPRIMPRFGNLSTTRFTVVVTDSYPG
jgi:hypothetical protein